MFRLSTWAALAASVVLMVTTVTAPAHAQKAPDWTLKAASGETVTFSEVQANGPSIVLFWATWCPFCKALMPHLQSMIEEYGDSHNLQVYAMSFKEDGDPVTYATRSGYTFTLFPEPGDVPELYEVQGTPGLFVVDSNGQIVTDINRITAGMREDADWSDLKSWQKAARRGPYWAARIREAPDELYEK